MVKYPNKTVVGWTAITLGLVTAITPAWATTTPVGAGFTLGFGAMTMIYGAWSLIAGDPTRDHWALSVVGLVLGISPWVGGYAGDEAAWVAWIGGLALLALGGAAYIADEAANVAETVRVKALATYQLQHPHSSHDPEWTPTDDRQPAAECRGNTLQDTVRTCDPNARGTEGDPCTTLNK
jgi:SPW repeat